jgi:hypothetical protein
MYNCEIILSTCSVRPSFPQLEIWIFKLRVHFIFVVLTLVTVPFDSLISIASHFHHLYALSSAIIIVNNYSFSLFHHILRVVHFYLHRSYSIYFMYMLLVCISITNLLLLPLYSSSHQRCFFLVFKKCRGHAVSYIYWPKKLYVNDFQLQADLSEFAWRQIRPQILINLLLLRYIMCVCFCVQPSTLHKNLVPPAWTLLFPGFFFVIKFRFHVIR